MNITGSQTRSNGGGNFQLYTGLQAVKVAAVNPTNEQYKNITGNELPFELSYELSTSDTGSARLVRFLCQHVVSGSYHFADFYIRDNFITNGAGDKFVFIDAKGQTSFYSPTPEEVVAKSPWMSMPMVKCRAGENTLIDFMQRLVSYSPRVDGANWTADLANEGYDINKIYNGDMTFLRSFIEFANKNENIVAVPFVVQKTEPEAGKFRYNQRIETKHPVFSSARSSDDGTIKFNNSRYTKTIERLHADSRAFSTRLYSPNTGEFDEGLCARPSSSASTAPATNTLGSSW